MSYVALNPSYYQILNPEGAWHPGAEGWSVAPYPGWGENTALVGPKQLAIHGLGLDIQVNDGKVNDGKVDCASDRRVSALGGMLVGGAAVGLLAFLLRQ